jgi:general stress protein 26
MNADKQTILDFMHGYDLCVFSTANAQGNPESALVGFSENDTFELLVGTTTSSRKYANIETNPSVSIVIGWNEGICIQYEGISRVLQQGEELDSYPKNHFAKLPSAKRFKDNPEQHYIIIEPRWLRYTDTNPSPQLIAEFTF